MVPGKAAFVCLISFGLISVTLSNDIGPYFNCLRAGQDCVNGQKCSRNGVCNCTEGVSSGYNCGLVLEETKSETCLIDPCSAEDSQCYVHNSERHCYCSVDSYGDDCMTKRYEVSCTNTSMLIVMNPAGDFAGNIYIDRHKTDKNCVFSKKDLPDNRKGWALKLSKDDCGGETIEDGLRMRDVMVQYYPWIVTAFDSIIGVSCRLVNEVKTSKNYTSKNVFNFLKEEFIDNLPNISSSAVSLVARLSNHSIVSGTVPLNEILTIEFTSIPEIEAMSVESCTATNTEAGGDLESLKIIENGCPTEDAKKIVQEKLTKVSHNKIIFKMQSFRFNKNPAVSLRCAVKVCPMGKGSFCQLATCDGKRKRRSPVYPAKQIELTLGEPTYQGTVSQ